MAIVRSFGALQSYAPPVPSWTTSGGGWGSASPQTYAAMYRTQPNVRTVVDFLARNIAQLGLHVFRRISDVDRERLADHELARLISRPNPSTTRYRLFETLMQDLGVYFNAFWVKVRADESLGLVRLPPEEMTVHGTLSPTQFVWTSNGVERKFAPSEIVHFGGYDPTNPLTGLSPLETLRRVLAEEAASSAYREAFWTNAARIDGVISRPAPPAAPKWTPDQKQSFREQWTAMHTGALNAGRTAVLEDGMTFTAAAHSAKDSEYLESRKLAREECAAAYHIPLPMVGILEHATFSNIREQHKHLYQDCLGPWLVMIEEEIERQVLPEFSDVQRVYVEFNIAEKLKGSFEEQAAALQSLVGAPVMTRNEGRSRLNLRSMPDKAADELVTPLNMIGSADAPPAPADESETAVDVAPIIRGAWQRQESRLARVPVADRPAAFLSMSHRWTRELEADLLPLVGDKDEARRLAADANAATLDRLHDEARTHG